MIGVLRARLSEGLTSVFALYFPQEAFQTLRMARGWGRSEEDLGAEKEQAREEQSSITGRPSDADRAAKRQSLELSLARIEEQLAKTRNPIRRGALEAARAELRQRLEVLESLKPDCLA